MEPLVEYDKVGILRSEHVALKDVCLRIMPGELVYLMGRVGSGKTSLLKSIYAEVPVSSGSARVLGYDLDGIAKKDIPMLRRRIGIVFQDFQLLPDRTAYDNLSFVLEATGWKDRMERHRRIEEALKRVGMLTKAFNYPHRLSGGEQQRIVIARALLNNPPLLLADEPTGNLDPETGEQIMLMLNEISQTGDTAVVIATHNHSSPRRYPGRILRCERKQLIDTEQQ